MMYYISIRNKDKQMNRKDYPLRFVGEKKELFKLLEDIKKKTGKSINKTVIEAVERYLDEEK